MAEFSGGDGQRLLDGRFAMGGLLGEGGMSIVYDGVDTTTGEAVAIKLLKPEIVGGNPNLVERFAREGEVLRRLNHPNIVKMLAAFEDGGKNYVVMEKVTGGDLAEYLKANGKLSIERTLDISLDLADALTRAHRLNIIHRDIKPANVLLAHDGTPRLTDFGVARLGDATSVTKSGTLVGTIAYLSPEGCLGEVLDARTDIWSFGVMLYEMLTGFRPFMDINTAALITAILSRPLPPLDKLRPNCPPGLVALVNRMLEKDREKRIGTARQVGAALEAIINGGDVDALLDADAGTPTRLPPTPAPGSPTIDLDGPTTPPDLPSDASPSFADVQQAVEDFRISRSGAATPPPEALSSQPVVGRANRRPLALIGALLVLAVGLAVVIVPRLGGGFSPQTVAPVAEGEYMVLVAQLEPLRGATDDVSRFIVEDLRRRFEEEAVFSALRVRVYPGVITSEQQAAAAALANNAPLVIWGNYDGAVAEITMQAEMAAFLPEGQSLPSENVAEIANVALRLTDPRGQSLAASVVAVMNAVLTSVEDTYNIGANLAALDLTRPVAPEIVGNSAAARWHRYLSLWVSDIETGLREIDEGVRLNSNNPILFAGRGLGRARAGRINDALTDARTALQLVPEGWGQGHVLIGQTELLINNDPEASLPALDAALANIPDNWFVLTLRGAAHYMLGDFAAAEADIERAIANSPQFNAPYAFQSLFTLRAGELRETQAIIELVRAQFPDPALGERMLQGAFNVDKSGSALLAVMAAFGNFTLVQWEEVVADSQIVLAQTDQFIGIHMLKGVAECNLGRYAEAEASYTALLERDPEFTAIYLLRAEVRSAQGDVVGAAADLAAAAGTPTWAVFAPYATAFTSGEINCRNFFNVDLDAYDG